MSTPNPLIPQGTFLSQASKGASNVRIAVATIVAIHVVFFGGLLLQGCKRDTQLTATPTETNAEPSHLTLPSIDSNIFYTNANNLPPEPSNIVESAPVGVADALAPSTTNTARDPWRSENLGATGNITPQVPSNLVGTREYTVVRGDTLEKIAKAHGTTINALRSANPSVQPTRMRPGMKLQIPAGSAPSPVSSSSTLVTPTTELPGNAAAPTGNVYVVKRGDTLTKVARMHGVTLSQLRAANGMRTSGLKIGQKLKIPAAGKPADSNPAARTNR